MAPCDIHYSPAADTPESAGASKASAPACLDSGQPSRTSVLVAASRAFGCREPDATVRNPDWLVGKMLGASELQLIEEHPIVRALHEDYETARRTPEVAGIWKLALVRTRFIDEHLERAVASGATQVVILGAGFDTRAYRFQHLLSGKKVFEVDHPSTQRLKKRRVREVLGSIPAHVAFVETDFNQVSLPHALESAGYSAAEKTFFIWEGVSMYLPEDAVRRTLRTVSAYASPGSSLVMDFAAAATLKLIRQLPDHPHLKYASRWGEPWIFGVPDRRERDFFSSCGLELRDSLPIFSRAAAKTYLTRADGTRLDRGRVPTTASSKASSAARTAAALKMLWFTLLRRTGWYWLAELGISHGA